MKFLLENTFIETYGIMIALGVILIVMIVASYIRNKKLRDDAATLVNGLTVGDDVKTYSGLCGKIVAFSEVDGLKTALIECDKMGYKGVFEIDVNAIYTKTGIVAEQPVETNEDANEPKQEEPKAEEPAIEEPKVEEKTETEEK